MGPEGTSQCDQSLHWNHWGVRLLSKINLRGEKKKKDNLEDKLKTEN